MLKALMTPALLLGVLAPVSEARDHKRTESERERYERRSERSDEYWRRRANEHWRYRNAYPYNWGNNNRYQGMDRNRDGYITRYEWRGNSRSFSQHDRNGDGVITANER